MNHGLFFFNTPGYLTLTMDRFPVTSKLAAAQPILQRLPGWKCDISQTTCFEDLPEAAKQYVQFVEASIGVRISMVSVGPKREQVIVR